MNSLKTIIHTLFKRHLFVTNVVSCGGLLFLGDGIVQTIEKTHARKTKEDIVPHDFQRSGNLLMHFKSILPSVTWSWVSLITPDTTFSKSFCCHWLSTAASSATLRCVCIQDNEEKYKAPALPMPSVRRQDGGRFAV